MADSPATTNRGKFIVIDGTDGTGKATQSRILLDRLRGAKLPVDFFDFPRYGQKSAGLVEEYLNGKYGTAEEVGPFRASIFYAIDRYAAAFSLRKALDEGKIVLANRYTSSSMGHQGGKIEKGAERDFFLTWLENLEFGIFGIPVPDAVIILYIPPEIGQALIKQKKIREYIEGGKKMDIHEADLAHLKKAAESYLYCAEKYGWTVINCAPEGKLLSIEEISEKVFAAVEGALASSEGKKGSPISSIHGSSRVSPIS
ncbi:MAG: thymidylate kinase [archaeon]